MYSVLFVEDGIYYIYFYKDGLEIKPTPLKLNQEEYDKWRVGKVEI